MKKQSGAIIIVALMMISVILMLTEQLMRSVFVGSRFVSTMVGRERAKALALSGVQIAMAQLLPPASQEADDKDADKDDKQDKNASKKKLLATLLPHLNRWQTFYFDEKHEGVEGTVRVCIVSEHGKININSLFDFEKQELKKEYEAWLSKVEIPQKLEAGALSKGLTELFTERKKKLHDISELRTHKAFKDIELFYVPPHVPEQKKEQAEANLHLSLYDMFTVWPSNAALHPLLFSDSLCAMLNLRRPRAGDDKALEEQFTKIAEGYQDAWGQDWVESWKHLKELYEETPKLLPEVKSLFAKQFEPLFYSVLSYGKFGSTEQRLLAIIKKVTTKVTAQKGDTQKGKPHHKESFKIMKVYWL